MSWKDASFSSLSCLEKLSPSSLSVFPFCIQPVRKKKIRFISERSLYEHPSLPLRGSIVVGKRDLGEHTMFGEVIKAIDDSRSTA